MSALSPLQLRRCALSGRFCDEIASHLVTGTRDLNFRSDTVSLAEVLGDVRVLPLTHSVPLCRFHTRLVRTVCHAEGDTVVARPLRTQDEYDLQAYERAWE